MRIPVGASALQFIIYTLQEGTCSRDGTPSSKCDMRLMVSMRANGMAPVTLMNMLPGSYHIYINAYDSEESVELRTQMFVDPFSVDIYLGNGVNSNVKKDTLARNSAGGKWFHVRAPDQSLVGTRALECGGQRDSG